MKKETGIVRIIKAIGYSFAGLKAAWVFEAAFRQETIAAAVLVPAGICLGNTNVEKALLAASPLAVMLIELLNAGLEAAVDHTRDRGSPFGKTGKGYGICRCFCQHCYGRRYMGPYFAIKLVGWFK